MRAKFHLASANADQQRKATISTHLNQSNIVDKADKIIQVLGITQKVSGCGWHRVMLPLAFMPDSYNHVCNVPTEEILEERGFDLLLYNRFSPFDNAWDETKKNFKVVMDLDDDWELPYNHPLHPFYEPQKKRVVNNIFNADLVTCTNERIADKVSKINKNVLILPNCIPLGEQQYTDFRNDSDKVRIFWAGGSTHLEDVRMLANPFKRLMGIKNIEMVLGGYTDTDPASKAYWDKVHSMFTNGGKLANRKLASELPNNYMTHFEHADIMVIPLQDSPWHASKSNLKILEAASKRIAVIVSDVEPYNKDKDAPVLWVKSQGDWYKHINYLLNNPQERIKMGNDLYEWAKTKYNYESIGATRRKAFGDLVKA
jgi:glycosyltransferase involved in cell wall biosynthesis